MEDAKPRTEVVEETRETLSMLELDNTPRPEKLRLERSYFDGAHEVRFTERTFRPKHSADLDDVRRFVDSLEVRRRDVPPLPQLPTLEPVSVPPSVPEPYRAPLERVIRGALVSVETVHRIGTGTVVDVAWESRDEGERRGLYIIQDDEARPYTEVTASIDDLPVPAAPEPETASRGPSPTPDPTPAKRMLGFGRKTAKDAEAPESPAPASSKGAEEPKKKRFGFGRK